MERGICACSRPEHKLILMAKSPAVFTVITDVNNSASENVNYSDTVLV